MSLHNMVHLPIPIPKAMTDPETNEAMDKEQNNFKNLPTWHESRVRIKQDEIEDSEFRFGH